MIIDIEKGYVALITHIPLVFVSEKTVANRPLWYEVMACSVLRDFSF